MTDFLPRSVALLALALPMAAGAFEEGTLPLSEDERYQRLAQQHLYSAERCAPEPRELPEVGPRGLRVEAAEGTLTLRGEDRGGKPWRVRLALGPHACGLYRADLDKDGTQDVLLLTRRAEAGPGPRSRLTVVQFDAAGRPVAWSAEGYFVGDEQGVEDVLDLDEDGQGEVVVQARQPGGRLWRASLYEAREGRLHRVRGTHARQHWPLLARRGVKVGAARGKEPFEADLGNAPAPGAPAARLQRVALPKDTAQAPRLELKDGRDCKLAEAALVALDTPEGREVAQHGAPGALEGLLERIRQTQLEVTLTGEGQRGRCSPLGVFATGPGAQAEAEEK